MKITKDDAFRILGVDEDSSPDEIRSCYKKLALKWHPDKHGDSKVTKDEATLKFQEVSAAYKRLTTNINDADDEIDDTEFMNIREMMELFAHIFFHNGVRGCPHHGMDCCDYDDEEYFYSDDEYYDYTDEESEDEFLDSITHRLRNKYEQRKYKAKDKNQTQRHNITEEEALRNARELIEEEEQEKQREEKKKAKRKKKKEKKKQKDKEKKEQEVIINKTEQSNKDNKSNKENDNPGGQNIADEKPTTTTKVTDTTTKQDNNNTSGKKSKSNDFSKKNSKNKQESGGGRKEPSKNKNTKNTDGGQDEEIIDTNSAFFARAASKAPHLSTSSENPKENTKKKKTPQQPKDNNTGNINSKKKVPPPLSTTSSSSTTSSNHHPTSQENHKVPQTSKSTSSEKNTSSSLVNTTINNTTSSLIQNTTDNKTQPPLTNGIHKSEDVILKSRQLAVHGNQLAQQNDYNGAVEMFSQAIFLDPTDHRFFGNRSYCYDRLESYKKALQDADAAIDLSPEWPKGYFRKGRALTGLKRFQEAEQVFQQVLKLDPGCEDAQFELARVRVQILIDMGFTQSLSEQAVRTYSTVQQALEALLAGKVSDEEGSDDVYFSDEEENEEEPPSSPSYHTVQSHNKKQSNKPKVPAQPKCTALWVGNVDPQLVTEKQMSQLFGKCGKVSSVRILPHKYCAFVNYADPNSAVIAMEKLQGAGLGSQKLLLRFPNNPPPGSFVPEQLTINTKQQPIPTQQVQPQKTSPSISESSDSSKVSGPVNGNECYFWRTTGCVFENQCRYKHVRGHKGVDLPKVQAKYGKLPAPNS